MSSVDGRYSIVFNGEIYNFVELREELEATGVEFRTRSDTEVLLELLVRDGVTAFDRLNGMFAVALLDRDDGSILLARDHFGQKPLYYSTAGGRLAFSSELPSLLCDERIERRIDPDALAMFLRLWSVPAPLTMIRGVRQLRPGQWLRWCDGVSTSGCSVWRGAGRGAPIVDDLEAVDAVRGALLSAVQRHLVADVPLGVFLSGGVDSAAIAAAAVQQRSGPVQTFTVRWNDARFDESSDAAEVAHHLGTDHHELSVGDAGFDADVFWSVIEHMGQPLADNSLLPTYLLCRETRRHVTVALSGDGGDEMFGGYLDVVRAPTIDAISRLVPGPVLVGAATALQRASAIPRLSSVGALRKGRRALSAAALEPTERVWAMSSAMDADELATLLRDRTHDADMGPIRDLLGPLEALSPLRRMIRYRTAYLLADQMLVKVDRMSMASSLEVRAPLLDQELAAVAARLSDRQLVRRGTGKGALREAVRPWLPGAVFNRPKRGFGAPLSSLRNEAFTELCHDLVLSRDSLMSDLFDRPTLEIIVGRVVDGHGDSAVESEHRINAQLWALLVLAAWCRRYDVKA